MEKIALNCDQNPPDHSLNFFSSFVFIFYSKKTKKKKKI